MSVDETIYKGECKRFLETFGFLVSDSFDKDIFIHKENLDGCERLEIGDKVEFMVRQNSRGLKGYNCKKCE